MNRWRWAPELAAVFAAIVSAAAIAASGPTAAPANSVLFENVRVFDGRSDRLTGPRNVLVVGNTIQTISDRPIAVDAKLQATVVKGNGRTLMPGLIDAHAHITFAALSQQALLTAELGFVSVAATKTASDLLLRGFTSIRDMGGPVIGIKRGIDLGLVPGPRIWPSGAFVSQTGGHGDFRLPNQMPAPEGELTPAERMGATAIADSPDAVRKRVREQLALGASQIKLMAGGGIASFYDPLDVAQYTVAELRAAVEAAENWGTYVTVHAYTPRAVRQAIEAGVKCIEHGQLLDEDTAKLMAERGVWWSLQPFIDDGKSPYAPGSISRIKQEQMWKGTDAAFALAKKYGIKTAFGTDILFSQARVATVNDELLKMLRWYTPAQILKMATYDNSQLLALSGERSPYPGRLGVVEEGALADLLLVDGDPLADLKLLADPQRRLLVVMKDGRIHKNIVQ